MIGIDLHKYLTKERDFRTMAAITAEKVILIGVGFNKVVLISGGTGIYRMEIDVNDGTMIIDFHRTREIIWHNKEELSLRVYATEDLIHQIRDSYSVLGYYFKDNINMLPMFMNEDIQLSNNTNIGEKGS